MWRVAGKQKLSEDQRDRIQFINRRLDSLWDVQRRERLQPDREFIEDRMQGDVFCDYFDRQRRSPRGVGKIWEEDGMQVIHLTPHVPRLWEKKAPDWLPQPSVDDLAAQVLREVLAELRLQDAAIRRALRHEMPLRQLREQQRAAVSS